MLATSNGGDKSSRNRESLRLSGITADAEEFSIYGREIKCFFCWLLRNFSPFTQRFFGVPAWGWYHYPRRSFHAVETLGARGSRRRIRRFYATAIFALCGLNIPSAGTHAPHPRTAHTAAHTPKHGGFSGSMVTMFSVAESSTPSTLFRQIRRSLLLLRKDTVMPFLLRASTLLRIRWEKLLGGQPLRTGRVDLFQQHLGRGADLRLPAQQFREKKKRIRSLGSSACSQSSDSSFQT